MAIDRQVAFISDADSPSGRAIAATLADAGMALALNSASDGVSIADDVAAYAQQMTPTWVTASSLQSTNQVIEVRDHIRHQFGRLDVVVHNHNRVERISIETCPPEFAQSVLDENVKSAFLCTQILGPLIGESGGGSVVFVGSIHSEKPTGSAFLYSVSKGAVQMLCREAALELGRMNVRANVIAMGPIDGDGERFESALSDLYLDYPYKIPLGTLGTLDDLAKMVRFVASDDAKYLNGADIRLDGGFTLHYLDHKMKRS